MSAIMNLCILILYLLTLFVLCWDKRGGGILSLLCSVEQEELAMLRRQLESKDGEMRRLQDETGFKAIALSSADPLERGESASQITKVGEDKQYYLSNICMTSQAAG